MTHHAGRFRAPHHPLINNAFHSRHRLRFADCDPYGVAHYPRLVAIVERTYEEWVEAEWGIDFADMIVRRGIGTPTVEMRCEFPVECRMGDVLDVTVAVLRLGKSSATLQFTGKVGDEVRVRVEMVVVTVSTAVNRSIPMPDEIRAAMERFLVTP